jgi:hypothetical protein
MIQTADAQMHRANLCKDLLGEALALPGPNKEATLRALYVWMRYSAVRAITWQRNYNTQPRCVCQPRTRPSSPLQHPCEPPPSTLTYLALGEAHTWRHPTGVCGMRVRLPSPARAADACVGGAVALTASRRDCCCGAGSCRGHRTACRAPWRRRTAAPPRPPSAGTQPSHHP